MFYFYDRVTLSSKPLSSEKFTTSNRPFRFCGWFWRLMQTGETRPRGYSRLTALKGVGLPDQQQPEFIDARRTIRWWIALSVYWSRQTDGLTADGQACTISQEVKPVGFLGLCLVELRATLESVWYQEPKSQSEFIGNRRQSKPSEGTLTPGVIDLARLSKRQGCIWRETRYEASVSAFKPSPALWLSHSPWSMSVARPFAPMPRTAETGKNKT
jgi:hypothetical protein